MAAGYERVVLPVYMVSRLSQDNKLPLQRSHGLQEADIDHMGPVIIELKDAKFEHTCIK